MIKKRLKLQYSDAKAHAPEKVKKRIDFLDKINKMSEANGPYSKMLKEADAAILICGDLERTIPSAKEFWVIDGSIAIQNMCLAATSLGVGNVWLGTWPIEERVNNLRKIFDLPEHIIPHSVLSLGIPEDVDKFNEINQRAIFEEEKVHYEKW